MVRTARERIRGLGSVASFRKVLMARIALGSEEIAMKKYGKIGTG
jgi:hypothetical protein